LRGCMVRDHQLTRGRIAKRSRPRLSRAA
jgi:hypothetical protein